LEYSTWGGGSGEAVARGIAEGLWDPALLPARFVAQGPTAARVAGP